MSRQAKSQGQSVVTRVVWSRNLEVDLGAALAELSAHRVLVVAAPSRRFVARVVAGVGPRAVEIFDGARVHVPVEVVAEASRAVRAFGADTLVTIGGGAATGLGKALRLEDQVKLVVIPTTYSGSEQTSLYGIMTNGDKRTGRDPRVRPDVVLYDASLTVDLPPKLTVESLLNALAHPVSALSTGALDAPARAEALAVVRDACRVMRALLDDPRAVEARVDAFRVAARAGAIIEEGKLGVHHRIAHFLGGRFGLEHAALHSALLPSTIASIARENPSLAAELADASGDGDLGAVLLSLLERAGAAKTLAELGVDEAALDQALTERPDLPATMIRQAFRGVSGWHT